jgi:hypothetical protein
MAGSLGQLSVVGDQCPTAPGGDQLIAIEAEGANSSEQAAVYAITAAAESLRCIFDHRQSPIVGHGQQCRHRGRMTEYMNGENSRDPATGFAIENQTTAPFSHLLQPQAQQLRIKAKPGGLDIHEVGNGASG